MTSPVSAKPPSAPTAPKAVEPPKAKAAAPAPAQVEIDTNGSFNNVGNRFVRQEQVVPKDPYYGQLGASRAVAENCATCHTCGGAGCGQHVQNFDAVVRGSTKLNPFAGSFFGTRAPTLKMEFTPEELQRTLKFTATVAAPNATPAERHQAVLPRLVEEGKKQRTSADLKALLGEYDDHIKSYEFKKIESPQELEERVKKGFAMPFGQHITASDADKIASITTAKRPSAAAIAALSAPSDPEMVKVWETFFNAESADPKKNFKAQLTRRYLFEHIAQTKIHFDESPLTRDGRPGGRGEFFEIVRSSTPPGQEIKRIATAKNPLANDDPNAKVYYRLKKVTDIISDKNTTVLHLNNQVKSNWENLFLKSEWPEVDGKAKPDLKLPGYDTKNPFETFSKIPGTIRSRFMLENAHMLINALVQADVCTGVGATYAIRDSFGAVMLKPESDPSALDPKLGLDDFDHIDPTHLTMTFGHYEKQFGKAFEKKLKELKPQGLTVDDIWSGSTPGEKDKNAYITVFRHHDNASSHQGALGQTPETMWLLNYANFERMFYDLVVNFEYWGSIIHKTGTWTTFSGVRANAEDTFNLLLPENQREAFRKKNTYGLGAVTEKGTQMLGEGIPSGVRGVDAKHPFEDVLSRVRTHVGAAPNSILTPDPLKGTAKPSQDAERDAIEQLLKPLTERPTFDPKTGYHNRVAGISAAMPDVTWATIRDDKGQDHDYTILVDRKYKSNSRALLGAVAPKANAEPARDTLMVVPGHIGSFVNLVLRMPKSGVKEVVDAALTSSDKLKEVVLKGQYNLRRETPEFKQWLRDEEAKRLKAAPIDGGKIDTSKYEFGLSIESAKRAEAKKKAN